MKKENRQLAREKKAEQQKKEQQKTTLMKVVKYGVPTLLLIAICVVGIAYGVKTNSTGDTSVTDVEGETTKEASDTTADTSTSTDTSSDVNAGTSTDSTTASDTSTQLDTDTSKVVQDGNTVNIDYVGTIDGVPFDGGDTGGAGTDLSIGSGAYIAGFEDQIIGHHVGETFDVKVTFPEDYGVDNLNGKEAVFSTTINGIYD